jgi:spore photoproduct lyase
MTTGISSLRIISEEEFRDSHLIRDKEAIFLSSLPPPSWKDYDRGDLLIVRHKGSFLRPCPATPRYNCCGLNIFHFGQGCHLGCTYCVLEAYLDARTQVLFGNFAEGLEELKTVLSLQEQNPDSLNALYPGSPRSFRYCTGEFTDSLLFDRDTLLSEKLIELFSNYSRVTLELKTKTTNIDHLLKLSPKGRVVLSFSLNAPLISGSEEKNAAPLMERIEAAGRAVRAGFRVGFHFDPIIQHPGWEQGYRETIENVYRTVPASSIAWISLGCFRYLPRLKTLRFEESPKLFTSEFIRARDGKMRYPRPLRLKLYATILEYLSKFKDSQTIIYLCMESGPVWESLFGHDPGTAGLTAMFS